MNSPFAPRLLAPSILLLSSSFAQHDYKVARKPIRAGNYAAAIKILEGRIAKWPGDSEWHYQMAIAKGLSDKTEEALVALNKALELGVHPGRVAADAHDLLKPLRDTEPVKALLSSQANVPTQGPMLGSVTSSGARLWLRTAGPSTVKVVASDEAGKVAATVQSTTAEGADFTTVLSFTGLKPSTRYNYVLTVNDQQVPPSFPQAFRTSDSAAAEFSLAFGGGSGYVTKHEHMWDTIGKSKPDLLLLLGDNTYSDDPKSPQMQKFCYYRRQSPLPFRRLTAVTPTYTIWDDHDFGTNDCSGGPAINVPEWKIPVWEVFKQNWVNPAYGGGATQPGCWYDFTKGNVHFIMLDGRYYRDHGTKTMLGPVQKDWLKKTLAASNGVFKVICSPVPWEYRTKGNSRDTWNGFQEERAEIFDFLADNRIGGVLLMSADRHRSDAWKIDRPNGYSLYEFNSSRLTNNHVHKTMADAIFSYNKKQSFGLVTFNTTVDDATVNYSVINIDGEKMHSLDLKRSQLE